MNKNKYFFVVITLVTIACPDFFTQNYWEQIQSPAQHKLIEIFFADSINGWAVGDSGTVIKTTDGGSNWFSLDSIVNSTIWDVYFLNKDIGWMTSWKEDPPYGSYIHQTTNGGVNWSTSEFRQEDVFINAIHFTDSLNGVIGTSNNLIVPLFYTTDGGIQWHPSDIFPDTAFFGFLPVYDFDFITPQKAYACGGAVDIAGVIWKTSNGGISWLADSTVSPDPINELYLFDSLEFVGIGGDIEFFYGVGLVRTTNGGEVWNYEELEILGVAYALDFRTSYEGWAPMGSIQTFIYSFDSGYSWQEIPTPNNTAIFDLIFIDSTKGFAVGDSGVILKYEYEPNSAGDNWTNQSQTFQLYQNYPNPFNLSTVIRYSIPSVTLSEVEGSLVTLKVYDVLGNEIATLVNEEKPAGIYEVELSAASGASELSSGIYFYQLKAGEFVSTNKMVVLK